MIKSKTIIAFILINIIYMLLICENLYAETDDYTVGAIKGKNVYSGEIIDGISNEYKENPFRAKIKYKDYFIGLIGEILSISSDGKKIIFKSSDSEMNFVCDTSGGESKKNIKSLSAGDKVIACGKVKKYDTDGFSLKADFLEKISGDTGKYKNCKISYDKRIFLANEIEEYELGNKICYIQNDWKSNIDKQFWSTYIENEYKQKDGMVVKLDEDETLGLYKFSWKELCEKANAEENKSFIQLEDDFVKKYLVGKLIRMNMTYGLNVFYTIDSKRTNYMKFDYFHGKKNGKNINSELFFNRQDDEVVAITYLYKKKPKHISEVELLIGSMKKIE